jgi:HAE1 family hydrophobic/amphiphilic exporter-1
LPSIEYPTIQVNVDYPGANPETMANNVTAPLEQQFLTIQGIKTISSTSVTGNSTIVLQFDLNKSIDSAATDVQAAITAANPQLPQNLPYAPTFSKVNPTATPIIYIAVTSPSFTLGELYEYGHNVIGEHISIINGVSQVITYGQPFAVRIQVDPQKLIARGIGIDQLAKAIQRQNVNNPVGVLYGPHKEYVINADGQLFNAAPYNEMIIKNEDGAIVRIKDIGHAIDSLQDDKYSLSFFTPTERMNTVVLAVQKQAGANTVEIVNQVKETISRLEKELPASIQLFNVFDEGIFIQESLNDVQLTLLIAILLVVIVIFIYLGKIMDTVIPSLAIPLSVMGTFVALDIFGYNIDILSLLAITLSVGFLVDDAIVVLENIVRRVEHGETPLQAAMNGSKQISTTILSMTLCLMSIFIPMLFMSGVMGRIFHEFAVTIVSAVLISGVVSLSLTPMLCSRLIPPLKQENKKTKIKKFSESINQRLINIYSPAL